MNLRWPNRSILFIVIVTQSIGCSSKLDSEQAPKESELGPEFAQLTIEQAHCGPNDYLIAVKHDAKGIPDPSKYWVEYEVYFVDEQENELRLSISGGGRIPGGHSFKAKVTSSRYDFSPDNQDPWKWLSKIPPSDRVMVEVRYKVYEGISVGKSGESQDVFSLPVLYEGTAQAPLARITTKPE